MDYKEVYEQWLANPYFDEATKEELKNKSDQVEGYILVALLFIPSSTTNDVPCSVC